MLYWIVTWVKLIMRGQSYVEDTFFYISFAVNSQSNLMFDIESTLFLPDDVHDKVIVYIYSQANMFIDRRFGEYDEKMSLEEKMLKRFTMEKKVWLI